MERWGVKILTSEANYTPTLHGFTQMKTTEDEVRKCHTHPN